MQITMANDVVKCPSQQTQSDPSARLLELSFQTSDVANLLKCTDIAADPTLRFSKEVCAEKIQCSRELIRRSKDGKVDIDNPILQKDISDSYVKLKLKRELVSMESIEAIKRFSEKKYGEKVGEKCKSPFDYDSKNKSCDTGVLDRAFGNMVNNCTENQLDSYCSLKNSDIFSTFDPANANKNMTQFALVKLVDTNIANALVSDTEIKDSIASIINSNESEETKYESLFIKLSEFKKGGKLDPILGLMLEGKNTRIIDFKKTDGFKFLKKMISTKNANIKEAIEKYRQDKASEMLGKNCKEVAHFSQICESATNLFDRKRLDKNKRKNLDIAEDDDDLQEVLNNIFELADLDQEKVQIVMDADKCLYLDKLLNEETVKDDFESIFSKPTNQQYPDFSTSKRKASTGVALSSENYIPSHMIGKESDTYSFVPNSSSNKPKIDLFVGQNSNNANRSIDPSSRNIFTNSSNSGTSNSQVYPNYGNQELATKIPPIDFTSPNGDLKSTTTAEQSTKTPGTNYDFTAKTEAVMPMEGNNTFFPGQQINTFPTRPTINDGSQFLADESLTTNSKIANEKNLSNETESKIEELNKKLAASEENLESMKAEKEAAEDEKEHALKVIEENKMIADLKKEITDLKAKVQTPQIKESSQKVNMATPQSTSNSFAKISTGEVERRVEPQQVVREVVNTNAPVNNNNQFDSNMQNGVRSAMPQNATATSSLKSGLVLTKINGNTTEKIAEGISEKILENDGTPFFIEEGGMIKEIIPVIENGKVVLDDKGKPLFEKVVKGKVGDKKFEAKKEERKPASITSKADLLRDQEKRLQYERAEYLKLKNITKQALDKK